MEFFQTPPALVNPYQNDLLLKSYLKRVMGSSFSEIENELSLFGQRVEREMEPLAQEAESFPPKHIPYDSWGKRIDHIQVSDAWGKLHNIAAEEGIVAAGYERRYGELSRVYQFAKLYLYHPSSAIYSCPLAMTDGAARVIELFGDAEMKNTILKNLTSRDPKNFWTSGQWMTERTGGSDVSGTSTIAKPSGQNFKLYGVKWFTSATTSQMAMTLAKIEGEEKLSLFYVKLRDENEKLQNIQINRLKEKLGTKALPTAELTLSGTPASLIGERGKGVKTISHLFNITRLYNACCAIGYMKKGIALATDYSHKRKAFGKTLIEHGLHAETLAEMQITFEASFLMTFHAALILGKEELKVSDEIESGTLRLLIPLAKLYTAKEGVAIASEVTEAFGGAGYVEDTGIPQLLRNAQVLSIWEGTTNVLALDAIRAIQKENAGEFFMKDLDRRMSKLKLKELQSMKEEVLLAARKNFNWFKLIGSEDLNAEARTFAMNLSKIYCGSLLLEQAEWSLENEKNDRSYIICKRYISRGLGFDFKINQQYREETSRIVT